MHSSKFSHGNRLGCTMLIVLWLTSGTICAAARPEDNAPPVAPAAKPNAIAERPNIVFAFADDWGRHAGAYAAIEPGGMNDIVQTPNFDALAKDGVLFTNAFVSAPSCTPCRSSLLSGRHFWQCGRASILQGAIWDGSIASYPLLLEDAGYRIGYTYKVWSPGSPADAPHGTRAQSFHKRGRNMNRFSQFVSSKMAAARNADGEASVDAAKAAAIETIMDQVRGNVRDFLQSKTSKKQTAAASATEQEQPFCYFYGPTNCHRTWTAGSGKRIWGLNPDDLKGRVPGFLPDTPTVREDIADYFGEAAAFDLSLGVLIEELKRAGQWDNTILVVSGDHGMPGVTHGKCTMYGFGTAVPLMVHWPAGIPHPGRIVDDFVSLPDLAPTFLDAAGVAIPKAMSASSILPLLKSEKSGVIDTERDAVFIGRERHV
ncbi:MAG: sulfatase, partial [Planctomycetota bacterium]